MMTGPAGVSVNPFPLSRPTPIPMCRVRATFETRCARRWFGLCSVCVVWQADPSWDTVLGHTVPPWTRRDSYPLICIAHIPRCDGPREGHRLPTSHVHICDG